MSFFSSHKKNFSKDIPQNILAQVRLMGDTHVPEEERSLSEAVPAPVSREKKIKSRSPSPFLSDEPLVSPKREEAKPNIKKTPVQAPTIGLAPVSLAPLEPKEERKGGKKKLFFISLGILILLGLLGGGLTWYFLFQSKPQEKTHENQDVTVELSTTLAPSVSTEPPYSQNSPNYLSLDVETVTSDGILQKLGQAGERMKSANMVGPVEFIITDKNNNPLAFTRLAFLANITLGEELLSSLEEPFSVFLYNDAGTIHVGLALTLGNITQATALIQKQESTLPVAFKKFLYPNTAIPQRISFKSGSYNGVTVRYVNIDSNQNFSMDYALRNTGWYVGTSKNTLRAMLDKK